MVADMFSHLQLYTVRAGALPYWHPVRVRETDPTSWACVGELGGEQLPFISPFVPSLYPPLFAPWFRTAPNDLAPSPSCVPVSHACSPHSLLLCVCIGFWVDTNYRRIHFNACGRRGTPSLPPTSVHLVSRMLHSTLHPTPPCPPTFHRSLSAAMPRSHVVPLHTSTTRVHRPHICPPPLRTTRRSHARTSHFALRFFTLTLPPLH